MSKLLTTEKKITQYSKGAVTTAMGLFLLCVGTGNIIDYDTNYRFVQHVLSMSPMQPWFSTTLTDARAITSPLVHTVAYLLIIFTEVFSGVICAAGGLCLMIATKSQTMTLGKILYIAGASLAFMLYFFGFCVGGGEWFCMWANLTTEQAQIKAFIISIFILTSICYIRQK